MDNEYIGSKIRHFRNSKDLSITELAKRASISQSYLSEIENGKLPSLDKLNTICKALGISLGEFFGAADIPTELIELNEVAKKLSREELKDLTRFLKTLKNNK